MQTIYQNEKLVGFKIQQIITHRFYCNIYRIFLPEYRESKLLLKPHNLRQIVKNPDAFNQNAVLKNEYQYFQQDKGCLAGWQKNVKFSDKIHV